MVSRKPDALVIGAGPAGAIAALCAADLGAHTVLVTRDEFGGMAANDRPVPVRVLSQAARLIREARQLCQYGVTVSDPVLDYSRLLARVRENHRAFPPGATIVPALPKQRVSAEVEVPFPLNVVFGISYRPTPKWNREFNADYTDWSSLDTVTIKQARGFGSLLPKNIPAVLNWQPAWYYKVGATRYFDNGWWVSAGYIYSENALPNADYTPLTGDEARHWLSIGTGFKRGRYDFDIAYQFGIAPDHMVSGSAPSATRQTADGRYQYLSHALLATTGMHF
ncbi:MAG TPA: outer membrane protein transport protein [Candidatus Udaeobacter sp.]|nr:outer membrane protein transport protein [Candidatus Udaeobacter sp.]